MLLKLFSVRKLLFSITLIFVISYSYAQAANELPQTFTLDGQLMLTGSLTPLSDANAGVVVQILDPSKNCLLYEEQQSVNTTTSSGYFNIQVGSVTGSTKRTANDPGLTMSQIYQNTAAITAANAPGKTCPGATYTPTVSDSRYFRLIVTPSATGIADTLSPDTKMDSVPMSLVAQTLQGYQAGQFLMIGTGDLTQSNLQTVFSAGNASKLNSLLSVPPSNYVMKDSTSGLVQLPNVAGTPAGVAAGQIWYDAGVLKYYDGAGVKTLSNGGAGVTDITAGSGLTGGVISTGGQTIAVDTGTTANKIVKLDGTAKLPAVNGSLLTNVIAAGLANGASIDITGAITTTGNITGQNISATGANFKTLTLTNASSQYLSIIPPAAITGTPVFTWPGSTGSSNQVLKTDGAGVLSWSDASSVLGTASGDLSGTYPSPTVAKLQGTSVSATAPTTGGQVLRYNGSAWIPNFVAMTDLRSTVTGTSQFGASCTSGQTLTYNSVGDIMSCQNISVSASNFANQNANLVLAGPTSGGAAAPSFRTLVSADTPFAVINGGQAGAVTAGPSDANTLTLQTGGSPRLSILSGGNVGLGTITPSAKLDVNQSQVGNAGGSGVVIAATFSPTAITTGVLYGLNSNLNINNTNNDAAQGAVGLYQNVTSNQTLLGNTGSITAISGKFTGSATGGIISSVTGINADISGSGGSEWIGTATGMNISVSAASVQQGYGIKIGSVTGAVSKFGLYQSDSANNNYFAGNVGIGKAAPGAPLDVKGAIRMSGATSGYAGFKPAAVAGSTVWTLPSADGTSGQVLSTNGSGDLTWIAPATGSVTNVTASAPLASSGGTTPNISIARSNATADGYLASTDWTIFNNKLSTSSVFSGDISGTSSTISVNKIRGTNVNITAIAANNYLKYNGTDWVNSNLVSTDITSSLGYVPANPIVLSNYLPLAGGTMSGDLNLGGNKILNLKNVPNASADPTVAEDGKTLRWNNTSGQWEWFTAGVAGAGITTLNGQTGSTQSFAVNNGGTFGFTSATNVHTLNIPSSTAAVTGLLSSADFTTFNSKLTSVLNSGNIFVGNSSNVATAVTMSGDATIADTGVVTLASTAVTANTYGSASAVPSFTVDAKGRLTAAGSSAYQNATGATKGIVQTGANITNTAGVISLVSTDITGALGYTPAATATTIAGYGITDAVRNGGQTGAITAGPSDANSFTLQTSGSPRMSILSGGNIGVGTAAPSALMHLNVADVSGDATAEVLRLSHEDTTGAGNGDIGASLTFSLETETNGTFHEAAKISGVFDDADNGSKDGSLRFFTMGPNTAGGTSSQKMIINSSGNVGIGATAPTYPLDVRGNVRFAKDGAQTQYISSAGASGGLPGLWFQSHRGTIAAPSYPLNGDSLGFVAFGNQSTSNYGVGMSVTAVGNHSGSVTGAKLQFETTPSGTNSPATRLTILDTGNVGIGTSAPGAPLDVKGEIRMSGATSGYAGFKPAAVAGSTVWTLPAADGSSGQVLSTNGSGDLTWASAGAGSVTNVTASAPLSSTGGATPAISIVRSSATADGYLASTDFTIFNNKLGTTTSFSGDVSGTYDATVLANSGVTAGTYSGVTVDAKGRVTSGSVSQDLSKVTGFLSVAYGGTGQASTYTPDNLTVANATGTAIVSGPALATANVSSAVVQRDVSGNFSAGAITATKVVSSGLLVGGAATDADALSALTVDFTSINTIRATGASAACGTLNVTNTMAGGYFTVTMLNATETCATIQWNGSTSNVKLPSGYVGGTALSGVVYTFIDDGATLWVSYVPF